MIIASIDPGVRTTALAIYDDSVLVHAELYDVSHLPYRAGLSSIGAMVVVDSYGATEIVIERPVIYRGPGQKGDQDDLIRLAIEVGVIIGYSPRRTHTIYRPADWKGQVTKTIMNDRVISRLSVAEKKKIVAAPKAKMHNIYDAIGIGLFRLGRL